MNNPNSIKTYVVAECLPSAKIALADGEKPNILGLLPCILMTVEKLSQKHTTGLEKKALALDVIKILLETFIKDADVLESLLNRMDFISQDIDNMISLFNDVSTVFKHARRKCCFRKK